MTVDGQTVRFCQQCGRFQALEEFDGTKKSCRRKLALHNVQRRRKRALHHRHPPTPRLAKERKGQKQIVTRSTNNTPTESTENVKSELKTSPETTELSASAVGLGGMPSHDSPTEVQVDVPHVHDPFDIDMLLNSLEDETRNNQAAAIHPAMASMQGVIAPIVAPPCVPPSPGAMASQWSSLVPEYLERESGAALPRSVPVGTPLGAQPMPPKPVTFEDIWRASYRFFQAPPGQLPPDVLNALVSLLQSGGVK